MAFIPNSGIDYDKAFEISGISLITTNPDSLINATISPVKYGLGQSVPFVSGLLLEDSINLDWSVIRPVTNEIISDIVTDAGFSGFAIKFYDSNRNLIFISPESFLTTSYSIKNNDLVNLFSSLTGSENVGNLNQFFIDVVSTDIQGRTSTGSALVDFGTPQVSISGYDIKNDVTINLSYQDRKIIKNLDVFVTTGTSFNASSTDYLFTQSYENTNIDSVIIPDLQNNSQFLISDNNVRQPYYVHLIPYSYFYSGQQIISSGIKPFSYNLSSLPSKISGLTGYVSSSLNKTDKDLNLEAFVIWDSITQSQDCVFHVQIEESGSNKKIYDFFKQNSIPENILSIAYGTGTGVSGNSNIFSNYGSSGIQWTDHTIYVDNFGSLPIGTYTSLSDRVPYITEIRIASGNSNYQDIFLSYGYTGNNYFNFLPSGGFYSGTVYTGTYSSERYLNNFTPSTTGIDNLGDFVTGIQIAKRITGFADFVYSTVDPSFIFPVKEDTDYFVKVRAINSQEVVSEFSDVLFIGSGYINQAINFSLLSGKKVIDGSGAANYIPKFSDSDTLTTGTLYYSGSNNLVFTELPTTTTSENLYKLVIEDNIIKKQLDTGNGTALIR